jgi:hypothetical protein
MNTTGLCFVKTAEIAAQICEALGDHNKPSFSPEFNGSGECVGFCIQVESCDQVKFDKLRQKALAIKATEYAVNKF